MTGRGPPEPGVDLVPDEEVAAALHRTAVLLTGDGDEALDLVVHVLRGQTPRDARDRGGQIDPLRTQVVRAYLRCAPRRPDGPVLGPAPDDDAYDVLRALRPRARAATVLRVAHGWAIDPAAAAVGLSPRRLAAILPEAPGLDQALEALGEQHRRSGAAVLAAVGDRAPAPAAARSRRWRRWVLAVGGAVALLAAWSALSRPDGGTGSELRDPAGLAGLDLTPYGWHLDEEGDPPVVAMGLQRQTVVEVPYSEPTQELDWDAGRVLPGGPAAYAVLWCDLPPADPHIEQPSARLTAGADTVELPCAGRREGPPVQRVTPVPVAGPGRIELLGDLPRTGGAVLALYREGALSATLPLPGRTAATPSPPVPAEAAAVDTVLLPQDWDGRTRLVRSVEVSPGTQVKVWAGGTGSVAVLADGLWVTDDGDLAEPDPDWREQQVDLREGRWVVYLPGTTRSFPLPEELAPPTGRTRTITLEVLTEGMDGEVQVVATDAVSAPSGPTPAQAVALDAPPLAALPSEVRGFRPVGAWVVPQDGLGHALGPGLTQTLLTGGELVAFTDQAPPAQGPDPDRWWGLVHREVCATGLVTPLTLIPGGPDLDAWAAHRLDRWWVAQDLTVPAATPTTVSPAATAAPRVWLPAAPGHPPATVLALEPSTPVAPDAPCPGPG